MNLVRTVGLRNIVNGVVVAPIDAVLFSLTVTLLLLSRRASRDLDLLQQAKSSKAMTNKAISISTTRSSRVLPGLLRVRLVGGRR